MFLGQRGALDEIGWHDDSREKLWRYSQHYFDDLNARDADGRVQWHTALIEEWIAQNPPGVGVGWEPYPTSLRIVNWIKWSLGGGKLSDSALHSLAIQARWLSQKLEFHLLGNHLFANAKALVFSGLFFQGAEAQDWFEKGIEILKREIPEQILADGGQFERSTMYHALVLEDVLDLCNLLRCFASGVSDQMQMLAGLQSLRNLCDARAPDMIRWLKAMQHPDGEISFFNDAALGIAPSCNELENYATRLGFSVASITAPVNHLKESGYCRIQTENAAAIIDFAPVGPDYLPGHAHADTLSFEFSVFGQRLLVNSGTSCYGVSAERLRQRGTAAHNTVVINAQDSSEVWGGFRVARRAHVQHVCIEHKGHDATVAYAEHDGYTRLPGNPVHARRFLLKEHSLIISDEIRLRSKAHPLGLAVARFHLHPDLELEVSREDKSKGSIRFAGGQVLYWRASLASRVWIEPSTWHPRFGESVNNQCLVLELLNGKSELQLDWAANH